MDLQACRRREHPVVTSARSSQRRARARLIGGCLAFTLSAVSCDGGVSTPSGPAASPASAPHTGAPVVETTPDDVDDADSTFQGWLSRSKGRLVTYTSEISCMCAFGGTYVFSELDGALIELVPIDGQGVGAPENWTITGALRQAAQSDGDFSIAETETGISIVADPEPTAIDDEWQYIANDITFEEAPDPVPSGSWKWLDAFGPEPPPARVPDGWQILDVADLRFAVPGDWTIPLSASCAATSPGIVLVQLGEGEATCNPSAAPAAEMVTIEPARYTEPGEPVGVGELSASRLVDADCATCAPRYRLELGLTVSVVGDHTEEILSTFASSGARRPVQAGEVVDTSTWQSVEYEGIGFVAPADWQLRDLDGSYRQTADDTGAVATVSGMLNPGTCFGGVFTSADARVVFLGDSPIQPSCPPPATIDLSPNDAIWVRPATGEEVRLASGHVNGLDISVLFTDRYSAQQPDRSVDLLVRNGKRPLRISLGVGAESSIARTILRSIHAL